MQRRQSIFMRRQKGMIRRWRRRKIRVVRKGGTRRVSEGEGEEEEGDERVEGEEPECDEIDLGKENVVTGEGRVNEEVDGSERAEDNIEAEENVEGKIPENIEGEILEDVNVVENEEEIIDVDDGKDVGTGQSVDLNVDEPEEEGLKENVDLDDGSETEETPVDERMTRRNTRRSKRVDELVVAARARKLQFDTSEGEVETWEDTPKAQETPEKEDEVSAEAVEKRFAVVRKRKGKQEAKPLKKKHRQASVILVIKEPTPGPIRVPFPKPLGKPEESTKEEEAEASQLEEPIIEMMEVLVTKKLLEAMAHFDNPKKALTCEERGTKGKLTKSGKRFHP